MIKIKLSAQLLYFVILCTLFQTYVKHIARKQTFNNVNNYEQQCLKPIVLQKHYVSVLTFHEK
jgi:hypothetical protein